MEDQQTFWQTFYLISLDLLVEKIKLYTLTDLSPPEYPPFQISHTHAQVKTVSARARSVWSVLSQCRRCFDLTFKAVGGLIILKPLLVIFKNFELRYQYLGSFCP